MIKKNQPIFFLLYMSGIAEEMKPDKANNMPILESYNIVIKIARISKNIVIDLQILTIFSFFVFIFVTSL